MESNRRSKIEIYFDILRVVDQGAMRFTNIMYDSNLSWRSLTKYLEILTNKLKFLEQITLEGYVKKGYKITELGKKNLTQWDKFHCFLKECT